MATEQQVIENFEKLDKALAELVYGELPEVPAIEAGGKKGARTCPAVELVASNFIGRFKRFTESTTDLNLFETIEGEKFKQSFADAEKVRKELNDELNDVIDALTKGSERNGKSLFLRWDEESPLCILISNKLDSLCGKFKLLGGGMRLMLKISKNSFDETTCLKYDEFQLLLQGIDSSSTLFRDRFGRFVDPLLKTADDLVTRGRGLIEEAKKATKRLNNVSDSIEKSLREHNISFQVLQLTYLSEVIPCAVAWCVGCMPDPADCHRVLRRRIGLRLNDDDRTCREKYKENVFPVIKNDFEYGFYRTKNMEIRLCMGNLSRAIVCFLDAQDCYEQKLKGSAPSYTPR